MTLSGSRSINQQTVYAQDAQPVDERDGVIWVNTSVSPRETFVYSASSSSWERVKNTVRQGTVPDNPLAGLIWIDTSGNNVEHNSYTGSAWELYFAQGPDTPEYPVNGSFWTDTGSGNAKRYDGAAWQEIGVSDYTNLTNKPTGGTGMSYDGTNNEFDALLGNALTTDANGNIAVSSNSVGSAELSFDTATQTEHNNHTSAANPHSGSAGSVASENGTHTDSFSQEQKQVNIAFANTYTTAVSGLGITTQYNSNQQGVRFIGWNTNSNGNITGMTIEYTCSSSNKYYISWNIMGELV